MLDWLLYLLGAAAVYFLLRPQKKKESTQDLLEFEEIHQDGLIELPGLKFRLVMEIEPVNFSLKSLQEKAAVWLNLRNMANALNIPCTFLVQTRYLNLKDYLDDYRRRAEVFPEHVRDYARSLTDWLSREAEGRQLRDRRLYVVLKMDAGAGVESGVQTDNPVVNEAVKLLSRVGTAKVSPREARRAARDALFEAAAVVAGFLASSDIGCRVLDRREVLAMLYETLNRDLAPFARLVDADRAESFRLIPLSETPEIILKEMENRALQAS